MVPDKFIELYYGKYKVVDLHGLTLEEAKAELIININRVDIDIKCLVVVHGYHQGQILKKYIRSVFQHKNVKEKVNLDAGRTILLLKF